MEINKYKVEKIANGTYRIEEFGMTAMYFIVGSEAALAIDCGVGVADYMRVLRSLTTRPIMMAVTSGTTAHVGGRGQFATMRVSRRDEPLIRKATPAKRAAYFLAKKLTGECSLPLFDARVKKSRKEPSMMFIRTGDVIDLGTKHIRVIDAHGYTTGSLVFLSEEDRLLFAGDFFRPLTSLVKSSADTVEKYARTVRALIDEEGWDALWTSGRRKTLDRAALADAEACAGAILKQNGTRLPLIKTAGHGGCRIIFRTDKIR